MSTTLFYFTGTGNSLQVARDLARELGDADIVSIPKVINQEPDLSAERIGIIYPVYMFGMPLIVKRFVEKIKADKDKYIFAVVTYGGTAGDTLKQNSRIMESAGLRLSAGFGIRMPGNYTPLYEAWPLEKQNQIFAKEKEQIREIALTIKEKRQNNNKIEKSYFLTNLIFSGIIYKALSVKIPVMDTKFWSDEKCTSCGVCAKVCPVNNIKISGGKPLWLHKCEQCFACLHWCPEEAIQYGQKTKGRRRYRNPQTKLEDLINNLF